MSFTIGIAIFGDEKKIDANDLLKRAEVAMYKGKSIARSTVIFYEDEMLENAKRDLSIENDIFRAIKNREFQVYYQPQLNTKDNNIIGAETLARWRHPKEGFISPSDFIPFAEQSGIIVKLEEMLFELIMQNMREIFAQKKNLRYIAINVSTVHFLQPNFEKNLTDLAQKHNINLRNIELELTENGVAHNIAGATQKIQRLRGLGVRFAIDDFGKGSSPLSYLKELPIDSIKIDRSFVSRMDTDKGDAMITESIIAIGKKFNLQVMAKGVENSKTLNMLKAVGCDYYQGNLAFEPMPFEKFISLLSKST